ncbi:MAG: calcium-binding protein, partial [Pararhodobacter sp.]
MQLLLRGRVATGDALLDIGIDNLAVVETAGGVFVISTSGSGGGMVSYRLAGDGTLNVHDARPYGPNVAGAMSDRLSVAQVGGQTVAFFGSNPAELVGYTFNANGTFGAVSRHAVGGVESAILAGHRGYLEAWAHVTDLAPSLLPGGGWQSDTVDLHNITLVGQRYVLALGAQENALSVFAVQGTQAVLTARVGAGEGLGIAAPSAFELVQAHGSAYAVVASSATHSISVMELRADGALIPRTQIIDTASTRFANVQALATAVAGDHVFVVAGGGDHGLSLFALLPDGRLVWLDTVADSAQTGLHNVSALSAVVQGDALHVMAGSQRDAGLSWFSVPLGNLGALIEGHGGQTRQLFGSAGHDILIARSHGDTLDGGAGNDILVSGPGTTWMRGGAGADTFVILADSGVTRILDFQPGIDRIDLSDWPMLRNAGQLAITSTAQGARIDYRGNTVLITSASDTPLSAEMLFPQGLFGPDTLPVSWDMSDPGPHPLHDPPPPPPPPPSPFLPPLPPPPPPPPPPPLPPGESGVGRYVLGTMGHDTLVGGSGNDTLNALAGDDLIFATGGNNVIWGGRGDDTIWGADGNDTVGGGLGDDLIYGVAGNNMLWGSEGNDTVYGGTGNDTVGGGTGDDLIHGLSGRNELWGGRGNDTVYAG